jgi:hypothetical protein
VERSLLACFISIALATLSGGPLAAQQFLAATKLEHGIDRPGLDYKSFDLSTANPGQCAAACAKEAQCQAFTYVNPGVQGPNPRCWLKNGVPVAIMSRCCASGVIGPSPAGSDSSKPPCDKASGCDGFAHLEPGIDRRGSDYKSFDLTAADPKKCAAACISEAECRAFTYVNPSVQGQNARCWLKSSVPVAVTNGCCTSGVISAGAQAEFAARQMQARTPPLRAQPTPPTNSPASDPKPPRVVAAPAINSTQPVAPDPTSPRETRVALVIGIGAYTAVGTLPNPTSDAEKIALALRSAGFETVMLERDVSRERLVDALRAFSLEVVTADWAVIYYAGHGMEINGINYLIPVDARIKTDREVQFEAVPLDQAIAATEGAKKLRLVVLDACRDNPFFAQMSRTSGTRSVGRGLARPPESDSGTLIAYAAKHGQVALDGEGQSPFVASLLKRLAIPGIEVRKLFGLVHDDVMAATGGQQEPFIYGALGGDDFFVRPAAN